MVRPLRVYLLLVVVAIGVRHRPISADRGTRENLLALVLPNLKHDRDNNNCNCYVWPSLILRVKVDTRLFSSLLVVPDLIWYLGLVAAPGRQKLPLISLLRCDSPYYCFIAVIEQLIFSWICSMIPSLTHNLVGIKLRSRFKIATHQGLADQGEYHQ